MKQKKDIFAEFKGYYTYDFSGEPFEGEVIKLDNESFNILFQTYSGGDEYRFREKLEKMDEWLASKPFKVYDNWIKHVTTWLAKEDHERD